MCPEFCIVHCSVDFSCVPRPLLERATIGFASGRYYTTVGSSGSCLSIWSAGGPNFKREQVL